MSKKFVLVDVDALKTVIDAATSYSEDLSSGLDDGTYDEGDPDGINKAIADLADAIKGNGPALKLGINVQGGVIQDVFGENIPVGPMGVTVIDYDTDGSDNDDLSPVLQDDGSTELARVSDMSISIMAPGYFDNLLAPVADGDGEVKKSSDHPVHDAWRRRVADAEYEAFDFGVERVGDQGWEETTPGYRLTRTVFLVNTDDPAGDSIKVTFVVTWISASMIGEVYAIDGKGNIFGTRGTQKEVA